MKILSKLFAVSVTEWKYNEFFKARVQLTLLYTSILAGILFLFSSFLYITVDRNFESDDKNVEEEHTEYHEQFELEFLEEFWENLIIANIILLALSTILGFLLAGKTLAPIQRKMRQQEQFSQDVAHELRTPLSALYASVGATLRNPLLQSEARETFQDVQQETKRLIELSERLLASARGEPAVQHTLPVSLADVIRNVLVRLKGSIDEKQLTIAADYSQDFAVSGDPVRLEEMFINIVHNAIKFSHRRGTIEIQIQAGGVVEVTDHGMGITKENLDRVWNRFFTTNTARDERGVRGAGLGLAIVREIAKEHSAEISLDSELGSGTTIRVHFLQLAKTI